MNNLSRFFKGNEPKIELDVKTLCWFLPNDTTSADQPSGQGQLLCFY